MEIYEDTINSFKVPKRLSSGIYTIEVNGEEELIVKKGAVAETRRCDTGILFKFTWAMFCKALVVNTFFQLYRVEEATTQTLDKTEEENSYDGYSTDYYSDEDNYATDIVTTRSRKKRMYNLHFRIRMIPTVPCPHLTQYQSSLTTISSPKSCILLQPNYHCCRIY